ncbi:MAG: hypothetical protein IBJ16_14380, partial [Chitinophagaceae bacterium]|nr:hypothetical protein [Chitinophagaceae bacterium]
MASSRLEQLFNGYLAQSLTSEEKVQFYSLVNDDNHTEQLRSLIDQVELNSSDLVDLNEESAKEILDAILSLQKQSIVRKIWWRYVAAACIISLMVISAIWLISQNHEVQQDLVQNSVIAPGTNKAILITSEGQEMVLDGKGNMKIGNALIQDGVATYHKGNTVAFNTLKTPRGGQFQVILPDGTHVWINSA